MPLSGQLATTRLGEVPGRSSHIAGLPGQPVSPLSGRSRREMKGTEPRKGACGPEPVLQVSCPCADTSQSPARRAVPLGSLPWPHP